MDVNMQRGRIKDDAYVSGLSNWATKEQEGTRGEPGRLRVGVYMYVRECVCVYTFELLELSTIYPSASTWKH